MLRNHKVRRNWLKVQDARHKGDFEMNLPCSMPYANYFEEE